ncbi:LysR family transcriptional regulator [Bradyrhizobium yuanmingense]|uniref:LysR family transcriptional regulator n=1 Tax=Bradyrhizobium yuanmingense TaxID=108015 RepID=UPI0023BA0A3A|nr:LysR family transcriptional regulator [Bradyrhizobium yuanmingense]MDF0522022.1 LysR family transcriptional regulator [Bradyrhizobium yuanmingense]
MNLSQLDRHTHRTMQFLAVARAKSLHAAARSLNLAQPSLTKSMAQLERLLGVPLFDRSASGVTLTKYGQVLQKYAEELEAGLNHTEVELNYLRTGQAGTFRIAAGTVWLNLVFPKVAAALQRHPGKPMLYCEASDAHSLDLLKRNGIDILCGLAEPELEGHPNFAFDLKTRFPLCLVTRQHHPLLRKTSDWEALAFAVQFPFVLLTQSLKTNGILKEALAERGLPYPQIAMNTGSPLSMFTLVQETDFVGYAAYPLVKHAAPKGIACLPLRSPVFQTAVGVQYRRSLQRVGLFNILMQEIDRALRDLSISKPMQRRR